MGASGEGEEAPATAAAAAPTAGGDLDTPLATGAGFITIVAEREPDLPPRMRIPPPMPPRPPLPPRRPRAAAALPASSLPPIALSIRLPDEKTLFAVLLMRCSMRLPFVTDWNS